jgi:hypothetical protein
LGAVIDSFKKSSLTNFFNHVTEFIGVLIAAVYYQGIRHSFNKWFLPFLIFIFLGELVAGVILKGNNIPVYYVISIGESVFYGYLFYHLSQRRLLKNFIRIFSCFFIVVYVYGLIVYTNVPAYYFPWLIISGIFLALVSLLYLYERFNSDDEADLAGQPGFWVALGVSVFFSGTSVVFSLHDFISKENLDLFGFKLYWIVPQILSVFLYACISVSIVLQKKTRSAKADL